jgi:hypothetical protein
MSLKYVLKMPNGKIIAKSVSRTQILNMAMAYERDGYKNLEIVEV